MFKTVKISAVFLCLSVVLAFAEDSTAPADRDTPPAVTQTPPSKREDCRASAKQQGLKAQAASDSIQICMAQARLDCTKDAVSRNIPNAQRRDFIRTCVNGDR